MDEIFDGAGQMLAIVCVACIIVLGAMCIDLASGLAKAKQRGELRSSWGLKRTLTKFITYEGGMLIAAGVDILIHLSHLLHLTSLDAIRGIPVITCLLGIFLLIVEALSVREAAEAKTKTEITRVENGIGDVLGQVVNKKELADALTKALINSLTNQFINHEHSDEDTD